MSNLFSISDIFRNSIYRIPDYQRGYSWREENLKDFWSDISELSIDHVHYMGTIMTERPDTMQLHKWARESAVFAPTSWRLDGDSSVLESSTGPLCPYYIVDGQQRLLTITILLSCLHQSEWLPAHEASMLQTGYLWANRGKDRCYRFGYEVDVPSHRYLIKSIYNNEESDEISTAYTKNLSRAKEFFQDKINWSSDKAENESRKLFYSITNNLRFNFYEAGKDVDVCVVFETMNNRGKPLSRLELLKNRLLYLSTQLLHHPENERVSLREIINDAWKEIYAWLAKEENQPALDDDDFLRAHWIMFYSHEGETGKNIRTSDFAKDLMDSRFHVTAARNGSLASAGIKAYVLSLKESVKWWFAINYPRQANDLSLALREWLRLIHEVKSNKSYFRPMIMGLLQRKDLSDDDKISLLRAIERHEFLVAHLAGSKASTNRPRFWREANSVFLARKTLGSLIADIRSAASKFYTQRRFFQNINTLYTRFPKEDGGWASWSGLRYFLRAYNASLNSTGNAPPPGRTVEHIFPKRGDRWRSWQRDFGAFSPEKQNRICSTLGNLVLNKEGRWEGNSNDQEQNSFEAKRERLLVGTDSEIEVAQYHHWRLEEIRERGIRLFGFMAERWDIPLNSGFRATLTKVNYSKDGQEIEATGLDEG
jgi:hypothetical protein